MTQQLSTWEGGFGQAYTDRNVLDWRMRLPAFRQMLNGLQIQRVLEVGCNRGHNLRALAELFAGKGDIIGIEPNRYALELARAVSTQITALYGHAFDIPFKDGNFDLVFTSGVLIHIPLSDLPVALDEICRVSSQYVLAVEYFAEEETTILYRGHTDLLWKRNFLRHYQTQCPELTLIRSGYWGPEDGFDRAHWWLLEKRPG
jgi:pseudaminic acid biosynthesis-associated methylase